MWLGIYPSNIRDYVHNRVQQRDIWLIKPIELKGFLIQAEREACISDLLEDDFTLITSFY